MVLFIALLIAYPWWVLTLGSVCYLGCLPLGWVSYKEYQRKDAMGATPVPAAAEAADAPAPDALPSPPADGDDRPARLN